MWSSVLMRSVVALLLALAVAVAAGVSESPQARADGALPAASSRSKVSDFTLKDIKGKPVRVSDYKGKVVLVAFWATWCKPCLKEMPELVKLQKKYGDDLVVLAISTDGPETSSQVPSKSKKFKKLKVLLDTDGKAAQILNPEVANPYTVFLDKRGRLVKSHSGYQKGDEVKHDAVIQQLLKES
ncbi:MAG: TlpA disulfide reductase family protein [Myxococcota bacterium]